MIKTRSWKIMRWLSNNNSYELWRVQTETLNLVLIECKTPVSVE